MFTCRSLCRKTCTGRRKEAQQRYHGASDPPLLRPISRNATSTVTSHYQPIAILCVACAPQCATLLP